MVSQLIMPNSHPVAAGLFGMIERFVSGGNKLFACISMYRKF